MPSKGLILDVYRNASGRDCTAGGVSSRAATVTLVDEGLEGVFEPEPYRPAVRLVRRIVAGAPYYHLEPTEPKPAGHVGWMFGGNYAATSDSRLQRLCGTRVLPIHDRSEAFNRGEG